MMSQVYNVLVICTGNSARSILGEVLFNALGKGRFRAYSAGSTPNGQVNPMAIALLQETGLPTEGLRSKSWDEFAVEGAPHFDFIFTVCDNAAGEVCPVWSGHPVTAHWGIPDPAHVEPLEARAHAFRKAYSQLARRIQLFMELPIEKLDRLALQNELTSIGRVQE
ncbi:MAG: protein-tyrosine-phosphatase [Ferrovum sp. 37-45-19]|nr:MAG: protein-tyrosine-phosphatase [Ferrovum sp. 21-44-67]OYV93728.1 MAG: protein-tyrosine-phosphatase [Ferrovum sp. 37-45-19]HQT81334.1 arsenate reductase ArsC [Ferrovaceae bacterium]HQU06222.1 arsenate reductase ArsC [Ferrovaceae bacterium]